ncbi:MAG: D-alanyl-D-alanine carboxypeptidase/D-alanyl-D-alanine-endopeptidase [Prevotella sp.]
MFENSKVSFIHIIIYIVAGVSVVSMALLSGCSCRSFSVEEADSTAQQPIETDSALQRRLERFASLPRPEGQFAFHVYDLTADKPVYGHCDTLALPSASCMKLLTGIAGLQLLGTDFHYWTAMMMRGKVLSDGTLEGDIAFRAGLNPQLMEADLQPFARVLKQKGVKRITGKLIIELAVTEPVTSEEHWYPWDLSFSKYGLLYKGERRVIKALLSSLRGQGIAVTDSQVQKTPVPHGFKTLHITRLSVNEVIRRMWKNSSNTQATALLYTIGHKVYPYGNPAHAGVQYLRYFMKQELGLSQPSLTIHDGCGLCTHNCLSPLALTTLLRYGYNNEKIRKSLMDNLAVAGVDGTLAREMTKATTRGKIRAKTGTLSHPYGISSLAGFCDAPNGHTLAFAIMDSEMSVLDARVLQRKLCEAMTTDTERK